MTEDQDYNSFQIFEYIHPGTYPESAVQRFARRQYSRRTRFIRWLEGEEWVER